MKRLLIIFILVLVFVCGCGSENKEVVRVDKEKAISLIKDGALLIDVRTSIEYDRDHIEDAINIDVEEILLLEDSLVYEEKTIGKDKKIIVYCRSGSRSSSAANKLLELGYEVYDLGSIDNWSK